MCLLLGVTGVGKTLLLKRLHNMCSKESTEELGQPPPTLPTVGTNLTDLVVNKRRFTIRELGGCMAPIWPSYYRDCEAVIFVIDAANPTQVSSSCIQLLSLVAAELLQQIPVLILFNKVDLPCSMSRVEMKSLFRMDDIIACAKQHISIMEVSAWDGTGLDEVLKWIYSHKGRRLTVP
ncbi:ADP-ribosylation factor-like protein 16 isoform X1 [Stegostoma tigrinum]|uniref:ADP-ribosylation factor-like protein 16 isoform X1 n=2 Tax=Stegostoma tigrinum TaxID=3053191 RepID=UPI00202AFCC4|nr:ADP-ribosylation factor-like protein 16 isoform X1 [Stegostoma tigrinum]